MSNRERIGKIWENTDENDEEMAVEHNNLDRKQKCHAKVDRISALC